jgi:sugar porter (SP) family MFS transporter
MLAVMAIPALIFALSCLSLPESPRWLIVRKKNRSEAIEVLRRINPETSAEELELLAGEIEASRHEEKRETKFFSRDLMKPLFLAFFIAFFNQLSGVNAILYYAPRIFQMAGLGTQAALLQSVGIGLTNLIFTFAGLWLIDRLGRRTLLFIGSFGYIASLGLTAWTFQSGHFSMVPAYIFAFMAAHAIGQGAVIWVFISEIFPNKQRSLGQSFGSFTHWFFAAVITLTFPILAENIKPHLIFGFFCSMMVLQLIWVTFFVPETKGISLEKMEERIRQ